ncbi:MAG: hypothetical protein ACFB4I_04195 [Cyanophyceae cyanobacterium]
MNKINRRTTSRPRDEKQSKDRFPIFGIFYLTALHLEISQGWKSPAIGLVSLVLLLVIVYSKINLLKFCLFIVLDTAYYLFFHFPEVANHVNLIIFCNLSMLCVAIYSWLSPSRSLEQYYQAIASPLRMSLIVVYIGAGFHKLNQDFLNPYVSCSHSMLAEIIEMLSSTLVRIPILLILGAISLLFIKKIIPKNWVRKGRGSKFFLISLGLLVALITFVGAIYYFNKAHLFFLTFVLATSMMVLFWELLGGMLLFFPRWQASMFFLSMLMHLILSPIGFVDFGSLAFALWLTFIPNHYWLLSETINIPLVASVDRSLFYVSINVFGGLIGEIYYFVNPNFNLQAFIGILFIASVFIVIAPLVKKLLADPHSWQGVRVINSKMPKFMYLFVAALIIYAATSYLGLRTAGNFSMFSNLRTEGETSNHLLLSHHPFKIWNYQEDVVKVIEIDDRKAKVGHKYRPLKDHYLPVVEFRKLIYKWTQAGYTVPLVFEYGDRTYRTADIVNDPVWRTPKRNWEMALMDFRVIQPDNGEPNYCRW